LPVTTLSEGRAAVELARRAITAALGDRPPRDPATLAASTDLPVLFDQPRGVFVTLTTSDGELRGCIGYPVPVYPLRQGLPRIAVAAAREDPRFPALQASELTRTRVEVSILTVPEVVASVHPSDRLAAVRPGTDGLIIDRGDLSGLLLPQVATEQGWDARRFLAETCRKAGLPPEAWRSSETRLRRFQAEVFGEVTPGGEVRERE
jgi:uncharacterized protein (TIGR00296 family)